jgi:hypothetical protein
MLATHERSVIIGQETLVTYFHDVGPRRLYCPPLPNILRPSLLRCLGRWLYSSAGIDRMEKRVRPYDKHQTSEAVRHAFPSWTPRFTDQQESRRGGGQAASCTTPQGIHNAPKHRAARFLCLSPPPLHAVRYFHRNSCPPLPKAAQGVPGRSAAYGYHAHPWDSYTLPLNSEKAAKVCLDLPFRHNFAPLIRRLHIPRSLSNPTPILPVTEFQCGLEARGT